MQTSGSGGLTEGRGDTRLEHDSRNGRDCPGGGEGKGADMTHAMYILTNICIYSYADDLIIPHASVSQQL